MPEGSAPFPVAGGVSDGERAGGGCDGRRADGGCDGRRADEGCGSGVGGTTERGGGGDCTAGETAGAWRAMTGIGVRTSRAIAGGGLGTSRPWTGEVRTSRPYMGGGVLGLVRWIMGIGVRVSRTTSSTPRRSDESARRRSYRARRSGSPSTAKAMLISLAMASMCSA